MPAILAKGLILSLPIIVAAGVAVYEQPEVQEWVNESRRKITVKLNELTGEIQKFSQRNSRQRVLVHDVSRHEDDSREAAVRREQAKKEIHERAQLAQRREQRSSLQKSIDSDNSSDYEMQRLKIDALSSAYCTSVEQYPNAEQTQPMVNELEQITDRPSAVGGDAREHMPQRDRDSLGPCSTEYDAFSPPIPPKPQAYRDLDSSLADTKDQSGHEALQPAALLTPTSTIPSSLASELVSSPQQASRDEQTRIVHRSIDDWILDHQNSSVIISQDFRSSLRSSGLGSRTDDISIVEHTPDISVIETSEADSISEPGNGIMTPSTWTEAGDHLSEA